MRRVYEARIVIPTTREFKRTWDRVKADADVRSNEMLAMKLIELYETVAELIGERRIDELIKKVRSMLGIAVMVVESPRRS